MSAPLLTRSTRGVPLARPRIVHLGLGAFHRAHQASYTDQVDPGGEWGIVGFTGRRPGAARTLEAQGGLYTLIERADDVDSFRVVASIVEAVDGADLARLTEVVAAPTTALITLTITEAGYRIGADGHLGIGRSSKGSGSRSGGDPELASDVEAIAAGIRTGDMPDGLATALGRLAFALNARRAAAAGPIALVPCDNLAGNGVLARRAMLELSEAIDPELAAWIADQVSVVSTSVDRITPRSTEQDITVVAQQCGWLDRAPVVTEPFSEWVLSGDFPAGRPPWEDAGALFVADIRPFETRKLWFLNGAHSLLAYLGQLRGFRTVADAFADPMCRQAVEVLWDEAEAELSQAELRLADYRNALRNRFANRRIEHQLSQIAMDGSVKLRHRVVPMIQRRVAASVAAGPGAPTTSADSSGAERVLAAWIEYVDRMPPGSRLIDPVAAEIGRAARRSGLEQTRALLAIVDQSLPNNERLVAEVHRLRAGLMQPSHSAIRQPNATHAKNATPASKAAPRRHRRRP